MCVFIGSQESSGFVSLTSKFQIISKLVTCMLLSILFMADTYLHNRLLSSDCLKYVIYSCINTSSKFELTSQNFFFIVHEEFSIKFVYLVTCCFLCTHDFFFFVVFFIGACIPCFFHSLVEKFEIIKSIIVMCKFIIAFHSNLLDFFIELNVVKIISVHVCRKPCQLLSCIYPHVDLETKKGKKKKKKKHPKNVQKIFCMYLMYFSTV